MDSDGDFVVVWQSFGQDGFQYGIFGQHFSASPSTAVGPTFKVLADDIQINTTTTGAQTLSAIAVDDAGNYVVAFESPDADIKTSNVP
jgi:hypothetical protein